MGTNFSKNGNESYNFLQVLYNQRLSKVGIVITYTIIWLIAIISFYFLFSPSDAMLYSIISFYIVIPLTTIVLSYKIGVNHYWGAYQWLGPLLFGLFHMLLEYFTYSMSNMYYHNKWNIPNLELLFYGSLLSVIGMCLGRMVRSIRVKRIG